MKYDELLKQGENRLQEVGILEAASDAWILFENVFQMNRSRFFMEKTAEIGEEEKQKVSLFNKYIEERCFRRPVQYITGTWTFMGLEFEVNKHVLIPRFDTECLVEQAVRIIRQLQKKDCIRVLDLCTGSGCIAVSIKKICSDCKIDMSAADLSEKALDTAKRNADRQDVEVNVIHSDLFEKIERNSKFDIIVSNPPYIRTEDILSLMPEVRDFEPLMALDGDFDGLRFYRRIIKEGKAYIQNGGVLLFEIGCEQGAEVKLLLEEQGYTEIRIMKDLAGLDRVVTARYPGV
ncbi:MAG: peptide chain release factor N(5)-glutamine methyltransferase [Lachnospiraceae bacterium]|nr:peptide chain release factor N(5)-glutamine methyltransferase [Lachnospiraceae bacterium]